MNQQTKLFLAVMAFAIFGLSNSCNQDKPIGLSKQDSVNVEMAVRLDLQSRQMDSLRTWVYEVEKDGRVAEYHQRKDYQRIITKLDSIGRREPRLRTICKAIGDLAGSMLGLNQVGKVLGK